MKKTKLRKFSSRIAYTNLFNFHTKLTLPNSFYRNKNIHNFERTSKEKEKSSIQTILVQF